MLAWRLSNRLDGSFCLEALGEALKEAKPEIFNGDQGAQFTCVGGNLGCVIPSDFSGSQPKVLIMVME